MHAGAQCTRTFFGRSKAIVTRLLACPAVANEPAILAVSWAQTPEECWGGGPAGVGAVVVSRAVCQDSSVMADPPPDSPEIQMERSRQT